MRRGCVEQIISAPSESLGQTRHPGGGGSREETEERLTCRQSREVLTIRGHFDWHANSNGRKYLSASMKLALDLTGGKVLEPALPSPGGGLCG